MTAGLNDLYRDHVPYHIFMDVFGVAVGFGLSDGFRQTPAPDRSGQVSSEASGGDPDAAQERLNVLNTMTLLEVTEDALALAQNLVDAGALPEEATEDALHIAIAVTNGIEYLVTWNCRHIANATMRPLIDEVCQEAGYEPVIICTPEELLEVN